MEHLRDLRGFLSSNYRGPKITMQRLAPVFYLIFCHFDVGLLFELLLFRTQTSIKHQKIYPPVYKMYNARNVVAIKTCFWVLIEI
jgi:hypothetical protein